MTPNPEEDDSDQAPRELPIWLAQQLRPINTDVEQRVVCLPDDAQWLDTDLRGVQIRVMEFVEATQPRLAAQLKFHHNHDCLPMGRYPALEILIQQGHLTTALGDYHADDYLRLPTPGDSEGNEVVIQRARSMVAKEPALLYLAAGQMQLSDTEWRKINTADEALWFPGPVEGTDVLPLHGHGCGNVMLVRWNQTVAFKTRIDPRGEELLVVKGAVYDAQGYYPQNTWIRNPISAWQSWGAKAGTMVYYKNGHFAEDTMGTAG